MSTIQLPLRYLAGKALKQAIEEAISPLSPHNLASIRVETYTPLIHVVQGLVTQQYTFISMGRRGHGYKE